MKYLAAISAAMLAIVALAGPASAEYPEKPVTFIVPFPPGDSEDVLTRIIAEDFQSKYGVSAAVVNKPGGGGGPFPGAIEVAMAPADGYTIGSFVIGVPTLGHQIGIDELTPAKFDPLGIFLTYPFIIATGKDAPYQTMEELSEYAKSNEVTLAHFGDVLAPTQVTKAFAKLNGWSYSADSAFDAVDCNTIASGDADVVNTTIQLVFPCLDHITVLATITDDRISRAPDAPTIGELEPDLALSLWNGLFVAKETPADVRETIIASAMESMLGERAAAHGEATGAIVYWQDEAQSAARIASDIETLARIEQLLAE
ncbi:MAG: tripartite tricarboxylate transporter substrate-binding protein [Rhodobacteraceae bacterium]|nr:tripartite tricarboxylate transporter substrate-binding protein [Paracoccaceae bacterium]